MIDDTTGQDPVKRPLRSSFDRYLQDKGKCPVERKTAAVSVV